jgi:hypothetical protein
MALVLRNPAVDQRAQFNWIWSSNPHTKEYSQGSMEQSNSHKVSCARYSVRPSILLLTTFLFALGGGAASNAALAAGASPTPVAQASAAVAPPAPDEMGGLIAAGKLPGLRWPNFSDAQSDVARFYGSGGNTLAWIHDGQPTAQAQAMIQLFKQASLKGLNPEDYDASRWDGRLAALAPSGPDSADTDPVHFDLALPFARRVSSRRCISEGSARNISSSASTRGPSKMIWPNSCATR